jgi:hypothetical protein
MRARGVTVQRYAGPDTFSVILGLSQNPYSILDSTDSRRRHKRDKPGMTALLHFINLNALKHLIRKQPLNCNLEAGSKCIN